MEAEGADTDLSDAAEEQENVSSEAPSKTGSVVCVDAAAGADSNGATAIASGPPPAPPLLNAPLSHIRDGWLFKEGGSVRTWKRRFFILTYDSRLVYYEAPGGRKINEIFITGAQVMVPVVSKRPHCFHVFTVPPIAGGAINKRSKYVLCAESDTARDAWVTDLRRIADNASVVVNSSQAGGLFQRVAALASTNVIRQLVSKKKIRFQSHGYDLDLTYVTSRLIAMGYPSEGTEAVYRNRYEDVYRFFEQFHPTRYKIYNLCAERAYPSCRFRNRVAIYPFEDHNAPMLETIFAFCADVDRWLALDEQNVVAVHCKAGKGRTGVMAAAYLLHTRECATADEAAQLFAEMRTEDHKGITIRSQLRYLKYFEQALPSGLPVYSPRRLQSVVVHTTPNFDPSGGCNPYFNIYCNSETIYCSKPPDSAVPYVKNNDKLAFRVDMALRGDFKIEFLDQDKFTEDDEMFYFWLNTAFIPPSGILRLEREEIDLSSKDKKHRRFDEKFAVEVIFVV